MALRGVCKRLFILGALVLVLAQVAQAAEPVFLEVSGLVHTPLALSRADLLALPHTQTDQGEAVCLSHILARAKPLPAAARVIFLGPDGFASSLVLDLELFRDESLRLLVPGPGHDAPGLFMEPSSRERLGYKWVDMPIKRMVLADEALLTE